MKRNLVNFIIFHSNHHSNHRYYRYYPHWFFIQKEKNTVTRLTFIKLGISITDRQQTPRALGPNTIVARKVQTVFTQLLRGSPVARAAAKVGCVDKLSLLYVALAQVTSRPKIRLEMRRVARRAYHVIARIVNDFENIFLTNRALVFLRE